MIKFYGDLSVAIYKWMHVLPTNRENKLMPNPSANALLDDTTYTCTYLQTLNHSNSMINTHYQTYWI